MQNFKRPAFNVPYGLGLGKLLGTDENDEGAQKRKKLRPAAPPASAPKQKEAVTIAAAQGPSQGLSVPSSKAPLHPPAAFRRPALAVLPAGGVPRPPPQQQQQQQETKYYEALFCKKELLLKKKKASRKYEDGIFAYDGRLACTLHNADGKVGVGWGTARK